MLFEFTEEQRALRSAVRELLADHADEQRVRSTAAGELGHDPQLWKLLAEQLGVTGLAVPERSGGAGAGPVELAVVQEEFGRALFCGPYLGSSVLAATLLDALGDETGHLTEIAAGHRIAAVALAEDTAGWDVPRLGATATEDGGTWRVSGAKRFVLDAACADVLLVVTRGPRVFAVDPADRGVTVQPLQVFDPTRRQADVRFDRATAQPVGDPDRSAAALDRALRTAEVMLAAEQAGGARAALDMAVDYARTRFQFGRAIGSFQAVKHLCADLLVEVESAHSAAFAAAWALAEDAPQIDEHTALAQAFCSEAFEKAAADNIQIHGGIGFTWEHPAHLYLRRARTGTRLFGSPDQHRERYLAATGC
ncbi:acyl-CoA/acyl-ACP dehydrogenase [Saccharopolyspora sp. HNM0983]|uniref:Acyl-CoA/acyl-ACP dehydrogenase n=1 Tax=Saccharopolyspora montiporae TaxID=2781240 RepID=A0A929B9D2_9PSEU|nr:acyl-CoA dehydrogenase family protein [Saccharopolyspora sp. HNM0983]MBE9374610.1 acyl-CoA/acyl-ACP dehydrogenase [Saccharopolyspora sp. HNM0983]